MALGRCPRLGLTDVSGPAIFVKGAGSSNFSSADALGSRIGRKRSYSIVLWPAMFAREDEEARQFIEGLVR